MVNEKNNKFILSNIYYSSNIKNNLISAYSILKNGCKIMIWKILIIRTDYRYKE